MRNIREIRLANARGLADRVGGTGCFAGRIEREPTQVSRIIGSNPTKAIGDRLARHIEVCFDLPVAWLDQDRAMSDVETLARVIEAVELAVVSEGAVLSARRKAAVIVASVEALQLGGDESLRAVVHAAVRAAL